MSGACDVRPILRVPLVALLSLLVTRAAFAQQPHPFGAQGSAQAPTARREAPDSEQPLSGAIDERLKALDSVVYRLAPPSRLQVKTGKAGLFGFAGHTHVIQANAFEGKVVYYPREPSRSHLEITVRTDSL